MQPSFSSQIYDFIKSVRTVMRGKYRYCLLELSFLIVKCVLPFLVVPLIFVNAVVISFKLLFG